MHIGSECLASYGVSFALPRDSILTNKFSEIMQRLLEAGLTSKWFGDAMDDVAKSREAAHRTKKVAFNLEHLQVR